MIGRPTDSDTAAAIATSTRFLKAYALNDRAARASLARASTGSADWVRR